MSRKPSPERIGREQVAREIIAASEAPAKLDLFRLEWATRIGIPRLEQLIREERLARGEITIADLPPHQRRELVDPANVDLHAIAAGPIMQPNALYLPAGRISLAEAKARESAR